MAFFRRKLSKRRAPLRRRAFKRKTVKKVAVKRMIKREIARNVENKTIQRYENTSFTIYPTGNAGWVTNVIPIGTTEGYCNITQGVGQGQRVGNKIKLKRLTIRGTMYPNAWNTTTNPNPQPLRVKVWFLYDKQTPAAIPDPRTNMFQNGSGSVGFSGDLVDMFAPVNTDRYKVFKTREFKLGYSQYAGTASNIPNQDAVQAYSNNDFKRNCDFSFDCTRMMPKQVRYQDTLTTPTSRGIWMVVQCVSADGGVQPSTTLPMSMEWVQSMVYEDA